MKKIYFVRHGQSEGNSGPIRQTKETPLTELGRKQAEFVAKRCATIRAEKIISSTMVRARQTAECILSETKLPIEYSDLFVERRRSSKELGKPKDDLDALEAEKIIKENFAVPGFRYLDEENFDDLKQRAKEALLFIAQQPENEIIVVLHGFFLRVILAYALFGDGLSGEEMQRFIRGLEMQNTGITVFEYDENKNKWLLWIWNDHAHLG
jgi:broad specificity phosphatase PhoE